MNNFERMMDDLKNAGGADGDTAVIDKPATVTPVAPGNEEKEKIEPPKMYDVLLHNDTTTPVHVVVNVLREVFALEGSAAQSLMLAVHNSSTGSGLVAKYPQDVAETKCVQAMDLAKVMCPETPMGTTCELQFTSQAE